MTAGHGGSLVPCRAWGVLVWWRVSGLRRFFDTDFVSGWGWGSQICGFAAAPVGVGGRRYACGASTPRPARASHFSAPAIRRFDASGEVWEASTCTHSGIAAGLFGDRIDVSTDVDRKGEGR